MRIEAQAYIDRIREKFLEGNDSAVASILHELNEDQEMFLEVWSVFPASMRRMLKEIEGQYRPKSVMCGRGTPGCIYGDSEHFTCVCMP